MRDWAQGSIFEFEPEDYIEGIWFIGNVHRDLMGMLWREKDGTWKGRYRFRTHDPATMDKDPHADNDSKTITDLSFPGMTNGNEIANKLHVVFMGLDRAMNLEAPTDYYYLPVKGDEKQAGIVLQGAPFAHMRTVRTQ